MQIAETVLDNLSSLKEEAGEFFENIISELLSHCLFFDEDGSEILSHISRRTHSRTFELAKIIQLASKPISNQEILYQTKLTERQLSSGMNHINNNSRIYGIYPYRHGSWCHISYIEATEEDIETILDKCKLLDNSPNEDFHSNQILQKSSDLSKKFDEFQLTALLRHYGSNVYLGRNMFAKYGSEISKRTLIKETIIRVLSKENRIMDHSELIKLVK